MQVYLIFIMVYKKSENSPVSFQELLSASYNTLLDMSTFSKGLVW